MHKHDGKTKGAFIDPICGMTVSPESAAGSLEFGGETIYFGSKGCLEKFKRQNDLSDSPEIDSVHGHSHEEMRSDPPGTHIDPICKMKVSPQTAAGKSEFCSRP